MNPNFIYILRNDPYDQYDLYDTVELISTDIKDLLTEKSYCRSGYDQEIIVVINGKGLDESESINLHASGIVESLKHNPPDIYDGHEEELEYVLDCMSKWISKKTKFLKEKRDKEIEEEKTLKAEHERREYERLKKKFESGDESWKRCVN